MSSTHIAPCIEPLGSLMIGGPNLEPAVAGLLGFDLAAPRVVVRIGVRATRTDAWLLLPADRAGRDEVATLVSVAGLTLAAGVGRVCRDPSDYARSRSDADLALQIARTRDRPVVIADELAAWRLLAPAADPAALRERAEWVLRPLLAADAGHGRDDLATLRTWLAHDRRRAATATALFVHENTVRYRLRRIAAVLGVDLADPEARFPVELAVRTLELLDATEGA